MTWGAAVETSTPAQRASETFFIQEYRVEGTSRLSAAEIETAVYPFLGPERTQDDVERARAALEQAYRAKGLQTVSVQVPPQEAQGGVVVLQVTEAVVGRLRVTGATYFSPAAVRAEAPSLAEGSVPDFNAVQRDIIALNRNPDRRVTPSLAAGRQPGTVDVELAVEDKLPVHASVELNNRRSPNTSELRLNGSVSATNLWQRGHAAGLSFQTAPQRPEEVKVLSGYYLWRLPNRDGVSLLVQGSKQDSNVSTLGGAAVTGRGETFGPRVLISLPAGKDFYQSASLGFDWKHYDQEITTTVGALITAPVTYWPLSAAYDASWLGAGVQTSLNTTVTMHVRGLGTDPAAFNGSRFAAGDAFIYLRAELTQTRDLPEGWQLYGKLQGQFTDQPLLSAEQFSGGGLGTARGYLESEVVGDNALFGTIELRGPPLASRVGVKDGDWRVYVFGDVGRLTLNRPLPGQISRFDLASIGAGTRLRLGGHFNLSLDLGLPLTTQSATSAHDWRLTFRTWAEF
jgi:hemolysin activation/secretion protein